MDARIKYKWVEVIIRDIVRVPENYTDEECANHLIEGLYENGGWPAVETKPVEYPEEMEKTYQQVKEDMSMKGMNV